MALLRGYLYVLVNKEHGWCKIGMTRKPKKRLSAIQWGCPFELEVAYSLLVPNARAAERDVLKSLRDLRLRGEWFRYDEERMVGAIRKYVGLEKRFSARLAERQQKQAHREIRDSEAILKSLGDATPFAVARIPLLTEWRGRKESTQPIVEEQRCPSP